MILEYLGFKVIEDETMPPFSACFISTPADKTQPAQFVWLCSVGMEPIEEDEDLN